MCLLTVVTVVVTMDLGCNTSWIDHVVCSYEANSFVADMCVLYDFICSDHRPLSFKLNCTVCEPCMICDADADSKRITYDWSRVDAAVASLYSEELFNNIGHVALPESLRNCCDPNCIDPLHSSAIDAYYSEVLRCVKTSMERTIPVRTTSNNKFNVPGWNDFVQDKYAASREAFLDWVQSGRPRSGAVFTRMSRYRASFKLALRYCRQYEGSR